MQPECSVDDIEVPDPQCPVTLWSDWSPCSKTCGQGVTIRTRLFLGDETKRAECEKRKQFHQQRECTQRQDCSMSQSEARGKFLLTLNSIDLYKYDFFLISIFFRNLCDASRKWSLQR